MARLLDFGKNVRGEHNRVIARQGLDQLAHLMDLLGVETNRGLIENKHRRVVEQSLRQADALFVPFRQLRNNAFPDVGDADAVHHAFHFAVELVLRYAFDLCDEAQVSRYAHFHVQRRIFRQVADPPPDIDGIFEHIESIHADGAVGCGHESGDDSHRGGFTGAVRTEESENLAFLNLERDAFDCCFCWIAFREVFNCDQS